MLRTSSSSSSGWVAYPLERTTLELIVSNRVLLQNKHGAQAWSKIDTAVRSYMQALGTAGTNAMVVLLDQVIPKGASDPRAIKLLLKSLKSKYAAKYLLILGGDDIVPFYRQVDQTADERLDEVVLSDTYYVDFDENEQYHWPQLAVGRMPDGGPCGGLLVAQLQRAEAFHRNGGVPCPEARAGFSAHAWQKASVQTYAKLHRDLRHLYFCPPLGLDKDSLRGITEILESKYFPPGAILFFNLHGDRGKPFWWGEESLLGPITVYPNLIDHKFLSQLDLGAGVVLCENCHGAAIQGGAVGDNLALCALDRGAAAFFGCTVSSYAVNLPNGEPMGASGIDAIFQMLIYHLVQQRACFGDALREAKQFFMCQNAYDDKNAWGLVLLGDPLLRFQAPRRVL
jgi:hypothetical protein